jgi:hypothetical protein
LRIIGVLLVIFIIFIIAISLKIVAVGFAANVFAVIVVCAVFILTFMVLRWLITNLS